MKKFVYLVAVLAVSLIVFGIVSKTTEANKAIFGNGKDDEKEKAKE